MFLLVLLPVIWFMRAVNPRERDWLVTRARGLGWAKNSISLRSTPLDMAVKFLGIINTFLRKYDAIRRDKRQKAI